MMNPWDSERTWEQKGGSSAPASGGSGLLWIVAIIIAVIGLAMMSRHGANHVVAVPIGISLFFMIMFMFSHRRETRRLAMKREATRQLEEYARQQTVSLNVPKPGSDTTMRKVFDRYDMKVISHVRNKGWEPQRIASFLDYARDYVDTQHATALVNGNERGELDRHLDAALHRALLQHDIENNSNSSLMDPPF